MPRVVFTPQLERFLDAPAVQAEGDCVSAVLACVFHDNPRLGRYVLDEHGRLRRHVNVFVNGQLIADRERLSDRVPPDAEVLVLQALSGG
jgi:molybdopterin synthase sulfur carrier subunit